MAGLSHDVLVQALREDPALLSALLAKMTGRPVRGTLSPIDSAVRFTRGAEVRPDVVCRHEEGWLACEVQNQPDEAKGRRWHLATAVLYDETGQMGDLVVVTASRRVARWAKRVAHVEGPWGTASRLSPVVLLLDGGRVDALLDASEPALALCAAWAMQRRHGRRATRIVERAIEVSEHLPEPLREAQLRAIFSVLGKRMRARLEEVAMNPENIPESPAHRRLRLLLESSGEKRGLEKGLAEGLAEGRAEGLARGRSEGLLALLKQRGMAPTDAQRARIEGCRDPELLGTWLERAVTAESVAAVLGTKAGPKRVRSNGAKSSKRLTTRK